MQAFNVQPPTSEKRPLSEHELEKISNELRRLIGDIMMKIFLGLGIVLLLALVLGKRQGPDIGQFGLYKGLLIAIIMVAIPVVWASFSTWANLKKDLLERAKIIHKTAKFRKEHTLLKEKFYARIESETHVFHEFEIDGAVFEKLRHEQKIQVEYAPNSKCLLKIGCQM